MITNLDHQFIVDGHEFIFDGSTLAIYETKEGIHASERGSKKDSFDSARGTFLRSIALTLTNSCNLACGYCYANQGKYDHPGLNMSFETARSAVDMVIDSVVRHSGKQITIGFFGGEPLLAFNLIKQIVTYVDMNVPDGIMPIYLITTNGTLLKPEFVNLMRNKKFKIMLSIDGDQMAHDSGRVYPNGRGSYLDVLRGLKELVDMASVTARITITDKNPNIDESVAHIAALGLKRITYALDYRMSDVGYQTFTRSFDKMFQALASSIRAGEYVDITNITEPLSSIVLKKKKRSHCNAGVSYLSVSAEGKIYRCPRFTGDERFALGTVDSTHEPKIDVPVEQFRLRLQKNAGERTSNCSSCPFVNLCGGTCYHHAASTQKTEFDTIPRECDYRKRLFLRTLEFLCSLSVTERRNYLVYLSKAWQDEGR